MILSWFQRDFKCRCGEKISPTSTQVAKKTLFCSVCGIRYALQQTDTSLVVSHSGYLKWSEYGLEEPCIIPEDIWKDLLEEYTEHIYLPLINFRDVFELYWVRLNSEFTISFHEGYVKSEYIETYPYMVLKQSIMEGTIRELWDNPYFQSSLSTYARTNFFI